MADLCKSAELPTGRIPADDPKTEVGDFSRPAPVLPATLPKEPVGFTRRLSVHLNYGSKGCSASFEVFAPDGTKLPITYAYLTKNRSGLIESAGFYLTGSQECLSWKQLRDRWPKYVKTLGRLIAAGRDARELRDDKPLNMIVIYDRPRDHPDGFVVRSWQVAAAMVIPGKLLGASIATIEAARELVPSGMTNIGRTDDDDPKITEVWV